MEIALICMYSVFSVLQIFILIGSGMISYLRGIYSSNSLRKLSMILLNYFLPFQVMVEIARMASPENVQIFWLMIVSVSLSLFSAYIIAYMLNMIFGLESRIKFSYSLIMALPALGVLPLVLGKSFCYPGGPLEGDPQCPNILGYMNVNALTFNLILFITGFKLIVTDKNLSKEIEEKMSYIWPIICENLFEGKNFTVKRLFEKYIKKTNNLNTSMNSEEKSNDTINKNVKINIDKFINEEFIKFDNEYKLFNIAGKTTFELRNSKGEIIREKLNRIINGFFLTY